MSTKGNEYLEEEERLSTNRKVQLSSLYGEMVSNQQNHIKENEYKDFIMNRYMQVR